MNASLKGMRKNSWVVGKKRKVRPCEDKVRKRKLPDWVRCRS